jgi:flagellar biogenesis protein FliO
VQSTEARQLGVVRGESDKEGPAPAGSFSGSWVLQTLSALAIVLALVFLVRTVMQRLSGIKTTNGPHGMIEVLGHWPVGPRTQVVLLRVMDRVVVAAQSSSGMDHLLTIEEPNEVASLLAQVTAERGGTVSNKFQRLLQNVDRLYQGQSVSEEEEPRDLDEQYVDRTHHAMSGLLSRMRRMQSPDA